jgi:diguanylate cyclase (GGDEF)-like protein
MTPETLALLRKALSDKMASTTDSKEIGEISEVVEVEQVCRDGRVINVEVVISAIYDSEGHFKEFVGVSRDITVRKKTEDILKYQSTHDSLTGLYNRAFLDAELELATCGRQFPVSVIVADLDGLKRINDTLGHEAGDALIKGASAVLQMAFRGNDIVARTGGDEFVILLRGMGQLEAGIALERIRSCMATYNSDSGERLVSMSLGTATAESGEEIPQALKKADELMYADKAHRKQQRI